MASYSDYPKAAKNNAKRALEWAEENGWGSCGTPVGKKRAADLAAGRPLSLKTVKRIYSFLSRHAENADVPYSEGCGGLMYDAWGGKSMLAWAKSIAKEDRDMNENKEVRCFSADVTVRSTEGEGDVKGNKLTGYAVRFNDITTIGNQFEERVMPTAFKDVDMRNTLALWNHNYDEPVGRNGKNLNLTVDEKGLRFDIDLPNTTRGNDIAELVRTGIVGGMSFGFTIAEDEWEQREMPLRTINQIQDLYEITFTPIPAYPTTEVAMRSLEAAMEVEVPVAEEIAAEEVTETITAEEAPEVVAEEVTVEETPAVEAEASTETVEAPSAEESVESQPGITKGEFEEFLMSLLK